MNNVTCDYIISSSQEVMPFGSDTVLCVCPPLNGVFVKKKINSDDINIYKLLMHNEQVNLAKIVCIDEKNCVVLTEYVSGQPLAAMIDKGYMFNSKEIRTIISGVCRGLSVLHAAGIVHRDINPNNIILSSTGVPVIIDFGIARSFIKSASHDTIIMGTPGYAAPEQFGFAQSDERTDIYAVGVLINVLITGKLPGEMLADGAFGKIVEKCTIIDATKRYASITQVEQAINGNFEPHSKLDRFIDMIPGLSNKNVSVRVVSCFGYIIAIILSVMHFSFMPHTPYYICIGIASWLLTCPIPFACVLNFGNLWNIIPGIKVSSTSTKRLFYIVISCLSLFAGFSIFCTIPTVTP